MKTSNFYFNIPPELIAQHPAPRGKSRMMVLDTATGQIEHSRFADLYRFIRPGSLLVVNDSKVRKARLYGRSETGGKVEFLLTEHIEGATWKAVVSKSKKQTIGKTFQFPERVRGTIAGNTGHLKLVCFSPPIDDAYLERVGKVPLPPYIKRDTVSKDTENYQTVYAREYGSSAAPTAGLHFTEEILSSLRERGIEIRQITLHVGTGTFLPIRTEDVEDHKMHSETFTIDLPTADAINTAKKEGKQIIAVGTTTVRALESAWIKGKIIPGTRNTDLFIYPGYRFQAVDSMITNFHTPQSSLIVMVSAFAGEEAIKKAYEEGVRKKYRFFSYGDGMLIL